MKKFESNVQFTKYLVNKEITERFINGTLDSSLDEIAEKIVPGPKPTTRCCIHKERFIIKERAKNAIEPLKGNNIINILPDACDECPVNRFMVTDACRGCLAHKCQEACPRNAIFIVDHHAYINQELCIECGRCHDACPYSAISDVQRPCVRSCAIGAIQIDENKKAYIDDNKCVSCGSCVHMCPFGAIVDKPFILDVLKLLKESENNTKYKVYAIVAPAIGSQFTNARIEQVIAGIEKIGFYHAVEAALGADIVSYHEAHEFAETVEELKWKTTSCCPAFVDYVRKSFPELMEHVSNTVSPMIAAARLIKSTDETAKIVFIGPCTAKKMEIKQDDLKDAVDLVITFEELAAMLDAMNINLEECDDSALDNASFYGRLFARSGGVAEAVKQVVELEGLDIEYKPVAADGLDAVSKIMRLAKAGRLDANFIEGMACKCGCIGGAASLSHGPKDVTQVDKYGALSKEKNSIDAISIFDIDCLELDRKYNK
ncbi:MAG: 4Fe-4S dicluster domain-containing protein [Clostridia bacterium]|nr:4Fe-4S dicluster domain-containing protein [Clostridia bacterium]